MIFFNISNTDFFYSLFAWCALSLFRFKYQPICQNYYLFYVSSLKLFSAQALEFPWRSEIEHLLRIGLIVDIL